MTPNPSLDRLPPCGETWELDIVDPEGAIRIAGGRQFVLVVCARRGAGQVLAARPVPAEEAIAGAVETALETCAAPAAGRPRRPARFIVRDRELADALKTALGRGSGVRVFVERWLRDADAAADLLLDEFGDEEGEPLTLAESGVGAAARRLFWRSAQAYHDAEPWLLVEDDRPIRVEPGDGEPAVHCIVIGGAGDAFGLGLVFDERAVASIGERPRAVVEGEFASLAVMFMPAEEMDERLVAEARADGWTGPHRAFPLALAVPGGDRPEADIVGEDDVRLLAAALQAVPAFLRAHEAALGGGEPAVGAAEYEDAGGRRRTARLSVPAAAPADPALRAMRLVGRARARIHDLVLARPDAEALLDRLAWSFFLAGRPWYASGDDIRDAFGRFLDWALFAAPVPGGTLAEQAIAAAPLDEDERARLRRVADPIFGVFRVEAPAAGDGPTRLTDVATGASYAVPGGALTDALEKGQLVAGPLFREPDGEFRVITEGCVVLEPLRPANAQLPERLDPATITPELEEALHGAGTEWIDALAPLQEACDEYDGFRAALDAWRASGLPDAGELRAAIAAADSPVEILQRIEPEWLTTQELELFAAFLRRLWNLTPRAELDGRSPEQMHRPGATRGRRRGGRAKGRKKKKR
jgi:hypothetical protein